MRNKPNLEIPRDLLFQALISDLSSGGGGWNNNLSRRLFLKRTGGATAGALIAWHSVERSWATETGGAAGDSAKTEFKKEIQWGIYVKSHPKDQNGNPKTSGVIATPINDGWGQEVGMLTLTVQSVMNPHSSLTVSPSEMLNGIPPNKIRFEHSYAQKGKALADFAWYNFLHPNDINLPSTGFAETVVVEVDLEFLTKTVGPWKEGETPPDDPESPHMTENPASDAAKNLSPATTKLGLLAEWSKYGWTWASAYQDDPNFKWTIKDIVEWTPEAEEAKASNIALIWGMARAKRTRTLKKVPGGNWTPEAGDTAEGWSKWLPD